MIGQAVQMERTDERMSRAVLQWNCDYHGGAVLRQAVLTEEGVTGRLEPLRT